MAHMAPCKARCSGGCRRIHRVNRAWSLPLLVAALALRLLFAPGMMPSASASGGLKIIVCPGMNMGMVRGAPHGDTGHGAAKPCPFEALGAPALAADPPVPVRPALAVFMVALIACVRAIAAPVRHAPRPPARAPPSRLLPTILTA